MSSTINNTIQFQQTTNNKEQVTKAFDQMELYFNQIGLPKSELTDLFANINTRQSAYASSGLQFGQDLAGYNMGDLNRSNSTNISFFYNRNKVLGALSKGLQSSQSLNDFYNFVSYTQNTYENTTHKEDASPILRELIGSAKRGISDLNLDAGSKLQLSNLLESNPQQAVFNPYIFEAAKNEILKRSELVSQVNDQSTTSDSALGRASQFGLGGAITLGALTGLVSNISRMLADKKANNPFTWTADPTKAIGQRGSTLSRHLNTASSPFNSLSMAQTLGGWKPEHSFGNFEAKVVEGAKGKVTVSFPDGTSKEFKNMADYNKQGKALRKASYKNYISKDSKEYVKKYKSLIGETDEAINILKASKKGLWAARMKNWGKYLPRRLGWVAAGVAALGYVTTQVNTNPNTQDTINNVTGGVVDTAKTVGGGAVDMFGDWFIPDFGVLTGTPWKEENQAHNILKGAYA